MRTRRFPYCLVVGALSLGIVGAGIAFLTLTQTLISSPSAPALAVEEEAVVGEDLTEGEATAWNNAPKLAVGPQGSLHVVYQYAYGKRGEPDRVRYARSADGQEWEIVAEWTGRHPTLAVDGEGRVYLAYVERSAQGDRLWLQIRGASGGDPVRLLVDAGPPRTRAFPALLLADGALLLAWEVHERAAGGHRIAVAEIPLGGGSGDGGGEIRREAVVEGEWGVFFPTLALEPRSRKAYLAWQVAVDARRYRVEVAVREGDRWRRLGSVAGESGDGRSPTLAPHPRGGVSLAFVSLSFEGQRESALYRARIRGEPLRAERLARRSQGESLAGYADEVIAFPTLAGELLLWGHTVPNACGVGPLLWALGGAVRGELLGEFASYPHLVPDPNESGVFHLVWTDRAVEELRAFEVRYARLRLRLR